MEPGLSTSGHKDLLAQAALRAPAPQSMCANVQTFRSYDRRRPEGVPDDLFRLRYDVYCLERAFLKPDVAVAGLERDDYDDCSTHFAAYTEDEALVGTVRLVTPEPARAYPFQLHCSVFPHFQMPADAGCGEISRLAVRRSHRRRRADCLVGVPGFTPVAVPPFGLAPEQERRETDSPMLLLGMYREMYRHSRVHGIRYWFAAMERSLAFSLRKIGFRFEPIGPVADYYGKVTPYVLDLGAAIPELSVNNPPLSAWFDEAPPLVERRDIAPAALANG